MNEVIPVTALLFNFEGHILKTSKILYNTGLIYNIAISLTCTIYIFIYFMHQTEEKAPRMPIHLSKRSKDWDQGDVQVWLPMKLTIIGYKNLDMKEYKPIQTWNQRTPLWENKLVKKKIITNIKRWRKTPKEYSIL